MHLAICLKWLAILHVAMLLYLDKSKTLKLLNEDNAGLLCLNFVPRGNYDITIALELPLFIAH